MNKIHLFIILFFAYFCNAQKKSSRAPISYAVSSNEQYALKSVSYDSEFPTLRGKSYINIVGNGYKLPLYTVNRTFELDDDELNFVAISNDGKKIAYFKNEDQYKGEEHKNITYYENGEFLRGYTTEEFIKCNKKTESCKLIYKKRIIDNKKSFSNLNVFKKGTDEKEIFLKNNPIFNKNDTIYIIDSRRKVTLFDLDKNKIIYNNLDFDSLFPQLRLMERIKSKVFYYDKPYKSINDFENIDNHEILSKTIENLSGLQYISKDDPTSYKYILHKIKLSGYLNNNGKFEIENLECDPVFDKKKIEDYLKNTVFVSDFIPKETDKFYFNNFTGGYRNFDLKIAEQETKKQRKINKQRERQKDKERAIAEKIEERYIPKNMRECMLELDNLIDFEDRQFIKNSDLSSMFDMNGHGGGLGMSIRNSWGINGGSRLRIYFKKRGFIKTERHYENEVISCEIISCYIKWLNGEANIPEIWERKNPIK